MKSNKKKKWRLLFELFKGVYTPLHRHDNQLVFSPIYEWVGVSESDSNYLTTIFKLPTCLPLLINNYAP